jgi:hypothetical protein
MKETIRQEIEKTQKRSEKMLNAFIPPFYEIEYNRGYIDGLRFALELIEKHEADEGLLNSDWGDMEVRE